MNSVKLTKKEQAILDTFARPYSTSEICERVIELSQNMVKFIWEDLKNQNTTLVKEKVQEVIPAYTRTEKTLNVLMSGESFETTETINVPESTIDRIIYDLKWLRFNHGTAMVGLEIGETFYVHKKFFDHFKHEARIRLEEFDYEESLEIFQSDDFPRIVVSSLHEIDRLGDWVVCERG